MRGKLSEDKWERKLKIKTLGGADHTADGENYPYEPTPYCVLSRLAESGFLTGKNILVDYGCGKGRAAFFLAHQTRCQAIGIDYNEKLIRAANRNLETSGMKNIRFLHEKAENHEVENADAFFFFNPFSEEVLRRVIDQILWSWYEEPRRMLLMFYYPTDETAALLTETEELLFVDEIDCRDLFENAGQRERILVFETAAGPGQLKRDKE